MNLFDELHHRLSSKTRIRSLFKDASIEDLEKALQRLQEVYAERLHSKELEDKERQKKKDDIAIIQQKMSDLGITLSDLDTPSTQGTSGKRQKASEKRVFHYENAQGDSVVWEGSATGRLPKEFQSYLNKTGKKRAECIID